MEADRFLRSQERQPPGSSHLSGIMLLWNIKTGLPSSGSIRGASGHPILTQVSRTRSRNFSLHTKKLNMRSND